MERKTIGNLIGVLRRANGLTQRELAERLGVTDKTVSHWECDETLPDLTLIPVLAEVFGVSCDELLRGEVNAPGTNEQKPEEDARDAARTRRQTRYLLDRQMTHFSTRSLIAAGLTVVGFLGAVLVNFGFLRAYIAFVVCALFVCAAIVTQGIIVTSAFSGLGRGDDVLYEGFEEAVADMRRKFARRSALVISFAVVVLAFCLPLVVFVPDAYWGLEAGSFFSLGAIFGAVAAVLCFAAWIVISRLAEKRGVLTPTELEEKTRHGVDRLAARLAIILAIVLFVTLILNGLIRTELPDLIIKPNEESVEDFIEEMETYQPGFSYTRSDDGVISAVAIAEISDEADNWMRETVTCGGKEYSFAVKNHNITWWSFFEDGDEVRVKYRYAAESFALYQLPGRIDKIFIGVYILEAAIFVVLFLVKRSDLRREATKKA